MKELFLSLLLLPLSLAVSLTWENKPQNNPSLKEKLKNSKQEMECCDEAEDICIFQVFIYEGQCVDEDDNSKCHQVPSSLVRLDGFIFYFPDVAFLLKVSVSQCQKRLQKTVAILTLERSLLLFLAMWFLRDCRYLIQFPKIFLCCQAYKMFSDLWMSCLHDSFADAGLW